MAEEHFELSGFASESTYERREPDWDGGSEYASAEAAIDAAAAWVAGLSGRAVVEVMNVVGANGQVTHVVTSGGVESIQ